MSQELLMQWIIILPLLAIPGILLFHKQPNLREAVTLIVGALLLIAVIAFYQDFVVDKAAYVHWWELMPGLDIAFRAEPLGVLFSLVAGSLWLVTSIYAIGYMRGHGEANQTRFYTCFAVAISAVMGLAFADNLFTLFVFYEVLTLSTYPLVTHAGTDKARHGGRVYLSVLLTTSILFLLFAIIGTWNVADTLTFTQGGVFDDTVSPMIAGVLLVLFVFGIGKAAVMPFHRWLPAAMVAPTPVSALLHAVAVVKAGVFSILKVCVYVFGIDLLNDLSVTDWLLYVATASVLLASLVAMRQDNLKKRLAYSTVSQLGYITIGALLATQAGVLGGALHIVAHAFGKITLFFCAGAIMVAAHKTEISDMRGLGKTMPVTMIAFFIGSLSIIGLPPAAGMWSKWYLLMGTLEAQQWAVMIVLMISSLLNIAYLLPIPLRAFFDGNRSVVSINRAEIKEAPWPSLLALCITAIMTIVFFFWPQAFYELAETLASIAGGTNG
ncbi:monovalent cation/H+ antiporter subunit D family protein [Kangiella sediminilitoris]|uniref:NADH dehydrogenase (Quinone) n=1 Tax=Kangiella sediminilitoris TaxID=1144748 RepID=A0A1B3B9F2_9GAMM|nr:monovalent cation/H+ antiporter subunit D family protein [Kangiella sediminilitoris]AOE49376.1 NADH dehydrogenase (Quinone) [Kangiella sediminilitoris]